MDTGTHRVRNARGQGTLLREEILAAADRVLAASPDEGSISLRGIAREAGIAAPSIYEHFADKQEILNELRARDYAELVALLRAAAADAEPGPDGAGRALAAARAFSAHAGAQPGRYRLMFEFPREPTAASDNAKHPLQDVVAALADAVADTPAALSGRFTTRELALTLLSALHGQISLWRAMAISAGPAAYPGNRDRVVLALVGAR